MKQRHETSTTKPASREKTPPKPAHENRAIDELGVTRGQNAEKGNPVRPENIVHRREAEH